jgi:hypothetical protein
MQNQPTPFTRSASRRPFGGKGALNPFGKNSNPKAAMQRPASKRTAQVGSKAARTSNPGACCEACAKGNPCNPETCGASSNPGRASNVTTVTPGAVGARIAFNRSWQNNWPWWGSRWGGWNWPGNAGCVVDWSGRVICPPVWPRMAFAPRVAVATAWPGTWGGWGGGWSGGWGGWPAARGAVVL